MPITAQALKKLRRDKKRSSKNVSIKSNLRKLIKKMRQKPTDKALKNVFQALDKATKINIIHKNKASRLKSRLSKLLK